MTPVQVQQLREYRSAHVIRPVKDWNDDIRLGYVTRCAVDGLRVIPRRTGWRHHPDEVRALGRAERGEETAIRW